MIVESVKEVEGESDLEITVTTGWWLWKRKRTYEGGGTVWHDAWTGKRAGTFTESALADVEWLYRNRKRRRDRIKMKNMVFNPPLPRKKGMPENA